MKKRRQGKAGFASQGASRGNHPSPPLAEKQRITPNRQHGFSQGERPYDYSFYESEPASPEYMARLFTRHDFNLTPPQLELFWRFYLLLRQHNASLDLTRIMGIEATVLKHFVDSAIITRWLDLAGPVLDIGSGPGFPGIPLAIMRPDLAFILAESRGKRVGFLEEVVKSLELANVELFPRSVREDSPLGVDCGRPVFDMVTRALEDMGKTLRRVVPFAAPGARIAFLKGPGSEAELSATREAFATSYSLSLDHSYCLPGTDQRRRLLVFTRHS
ncbi:MAG: 16S rRNA (guanine(527)-N(7))-methyltransferase RsmG [Planctomycetota bacterium]|nr:16S rRNA (guanine(527)-N(7))-methyltransferase RsmG [Planctomycetota bacterium]